MIDALNIGLTGLILGLALWSIVAREAFAAVAGFMAYGLLLTLVWVQLHGIDVALTEAAIGGGLTGALLIGAVSRLRSTEAAARAEQPGAPARWLAAGVSAAVAAALAVCVLVLPDPAPTLAPAVATHIAVTEVGNPITAVLMAFRAMDTLLEAIVLLFALIGVWSLAPDRFWGGRPGLRQHADPNGILAYVARILPPIGVIAGIYIFWVGADVPRVARAGRGVAHRPGAATRHPRADRHAARADRGHVPGALRRRRHRPSVLCRGAALRLRTARRAGARADRRR